MILEFQAVAIRSDGHRIWWVSGMGSTAMASLPGYWWCSDCGMSSFDRLHWFYDSPYWLSVRSPNARSGAYRPERAQHAGAPVEVEP